MFYHPNDNKFTIMLKHMIFWLVFFTMATSLVFVISDDVKVPQKEVVLKIDVKDKVNICLPEDEKIFEKSFFDF